MAITVDLPRDIEDHLGMVWNGDLPRKVLEAIAVEAYRERKIGTAQVRRLLGFESRWETIRFLSDRRVYPNYNEDDLESDMKNLAELEANRPG